MSASGVVPGAAATTAIAPVKVKKIACIGAGELPRSLAYCSGREWTPSIRLRRWSNLLHHRSEVSPYSRYAMRPPLIASNAL